jgi:hypothetical protein
MQERPMNKSVNIQQNRYFPKSYCMSRNTVKSPPTWICPTRIQLHVRENKCQQFFANAGNSIIRGLPNAL